MLKEKFDYVVGALGALGAALIPNAERVGLAADQEEDGEDGKEEVVPSVHILKGVLRSMDFYADVDEL